MRETTRNFKYMFRNISRDRPLDFITPVFPIGDREPVRKIEAKENRKVVKYSSGSLWFFLVVYPSSPTLDRFFFLSSFLGSSSCSSSANFKHCVRRSFVKLKAARR